MCTLPQPPFAGSYKHTCSHAYQDSVGKVVLETCRAVPQGVLCFFPSYSLLEKVVSRWKSTGCWKALAAVKSIFVEQKKAGPFDREGKTDIQNEKHADSQETCRDRQRDERPKTFVLFGFVVAGAEFDKSLQRFTDCNNPDNKVDEAATKQGASSSRTGRTGRTGGVFFAVFRGKLSEGVV